MLINPDVRKLRLEDGVWGQPELDSKRRKKVNVSSSTPFRPKFL
jgi:hypothetical protein